MGPGARAARGLPPTDDPDWKGCGLCGAMVAPGKAKQHNNFHDLIAGRIEEAEATARRAIAQAERRREELQALARSILQTQERVEANGAACAKEGGELREGLARAGSALASLRNICQGLKDGLLKLDERTRRDG